MLAEGLKWETNNHYLTLFSIIDFHLLPPTPTTTTTNTNLFFTITRATTRCCMEQLKSDIEANRKKNESLEKRNAALERQVCELRDTIYKQQSRVPPIVETNVAALNNQIHELKSAVSRLESSSHQPTPVSTSIGLGSDAVLKKEVDRLEHRVMQLELDSLMGVRKQEMEKIVEKNAEFENRLAQLTTTIDELKSLSSHETDLTNSRVGTSTGMRSDAVLKKEVDRLEHRIMQLELDTFLIHKRNFTDGKEHTKYETTSIKGKEVQRVSRNTTSIPTRLAPRGEPYHMVAQALDSDFLMGIRKQEMEKIVEKNAEFENRLAQLTTTIDQLKSSSSHETGLTTPTEADHGIQGHERDNLVSCLIVLIFLVSILIGVNI
ncbi:unnamed protein product [Camellia sinensis]